MNQNATLEETLLKILDETKAEDILSLDIRHLTNIADKMIICTGTSRRHIKAISEHAVFAAKELGAQPLGVEGEEASEWILIDLDSIIIHIMLPQLRDFYSLEKLWAMAESVKKSNEGKPS